MLIVILVTVVALVAWSLHLMQEAVNHREFSLMLAGTLVAMAAAALMGVYFLMGHYVGYVSQMAMTQQSLLANRSSDLTLGIVSASSVDFGSPGEEDWPIVTTHRP